MIHQKRQKGLLDLFGTYMAAAALAEEGEPEMARRFIGHRRGLAGKGPRPPMPPVMFWPLLVTP